ncbi:MAG: YjfB family protein [Treponema sp.]|jgi:hypothetical protein|nr:YjfB family protein [Treponema sp.]
MTIEEVSMGMAQDRVQQEAALKIEAMALRGAEDQAAALMKLMESAETVGDPNMGNRVDLLA